MKPNYRRCLICRKIGLKDEFWRIVRLFPSGQVQLDRGMGRSTYICPQASCLCASQKKNRLGRSLCASVPEALYQTLWQRLSAPPEQKRGKSASKNPLQQVVLAHPQNDYNTDP